jgi:hypothetical protein
MCKVQRHAHKIWWKTMTEIWNPNTLIAYCTSVAWENKVIEQIMTGMSSPTTLNRILRFCSLRKKCADCRINVCHCVIEMCTCSEPERKENNCLVHTVQIISIARRTVVTTKWKYITMTEIQFALSNYTSPTEYNIVAKFHLKH